MVTRPTGELSVFFSMPWCCVLPAVLSFVSLGSAAAARVALMKLMLPLLVLSVAFLTYAHLRVWVRKEGRPAAPKKLTRIRPLLRHKTKPRHTGRGQQLLHGPDGSRIDIRSQNPPRRSLVEDDHMVQTRAASRPDQPLHIRIPPRTLRGDSDGTGCFQDCVRLVSHQWFVSRLGGLFRNLWCAGQLHRLSEGFGQVSMRRMISSPFSFVIALGEYSMSPPVTLSRNDDSV